MLHGARIFPCDKVKDAPCKHCEANGDEAEDRPDGLRVIAPGNDVVHVSHKSSDRDQPHMHHQKAQITNHQNKMNGSRSLPAPEELREKRKPRGNATLAPCPRCAGIQAKPATGKCNGHRPSPSTNGRSALSAA